MSITIIWNAYVCEKAWASVNCLNPLLANYNKIWDSYFNVG